MRPDKTGQGDIARSDGDVAAWFWCGSVSKIGSRAIVMVNDVAGSVWKHRGRSVHTSMDADDENVMKGVDD